MLIADFKKNTNIGHSYCFNSFADINLYLQETDVQQQA